MDKLTVDTHYLDSLKKPLIDEHYNFTHITSLTDFVDKAYGIFSIYPLVKQTAMCDCGGCFPKPLITRWKNYSNIDTIPDEILECYLSSEVIEESIIAQQMHALLPRLMRSFIQGKEFGILGRDAAFNYCQFSSNQFTTWLTSEKQFMQDFALTYFDCYINHPEGWTRFLEFEGAIDIVTMFYMSGLDIQPLLDLWMSHLDKLLACLYLSLIVRMDMENGRFYSILAEDYPTYSMLVNTWINTNAKKITSAFIAMTNRSNFNSLPDNERLCITEALQYFRRLS